MIHELSRREEHSETLAGDLQPEFEEHAQTELASGITEALGERQQDRLGDIGAALARIEADTYGECQNCGRPIGEERLEATPTTTFCGDCASEEEANVAGQAEESAEEETPASGPLPPDLESMDDQELQDHLRDLVGEDGQVDLHELQIIARNGVVYLEGALPITRMWPAYRKSLISWKLSGSPGSARIAEKMKRSKMSCPGNSTSGTYGGTDDVVLADEEGVTYEPPENRRLRRTVSTEEPGLGQQFNAEVLATLRSRCSDRSTPHRKATQPSRIPDMRQDATLHRNSRGPGGDFPPKLWITLWIIYFFAPETRYRAGFEQNAV